MIKLPFEFIIEGPPISLQTKNKSRLGQWKGDVANAAKAKLVSTSTPTNLDVAITITNYYEDDCPDVDNIIKPIQDALIGIVYQDDDQVVDTRSIKKDINGSYKIRNISFIILEGFSKGNEFLHVKVSEYKNDKGFQFACNS